MTAMTPKGTVIFLILKPFGIDFSRRLTPNGLGKLATFLTSFANDKILSLFNNKRSYLGSCSSIKLKSF
ncbi:Uncharacterised protein [Legionella pneumophila]|nr:Uncharacterised protein [Legionella pneumophila]